MARQVVQFARGSKAAYNIYTSEEKARKIYFAQDTNEIIVNDVSYGVNLKALDLDIIATVEVTGPGQFVFTKTNGKTTSVSIPIATQESNGLLSKEDKKFIDSIPTVYATKEELDQQVSRVYRFKGTLQFFYELPASDQIIGDTYNILNDFQIGDDTYSGGTDVAWDGSKWNPLGGKSGYSKEESDAKYVTWIQDGNTKSISIPQNGSVKGTQVDNSQTNLIKLGLYSDGLLQTVDVGSVNTQLNLYSSERPNIKLANDISEKLAYMSDIGQIDLSSYTSGVVSYIPELYQEFIDENGNPVNINGQLYNPVTNPYVLGRNYVVVEWVDDNQSKHYDLFTSETVIPNATLAAINSVRSECLLTWEENNN